jgi:hypothetical protein
VCVSVLLFVSWPIGMDFGFQLVNTAKRQIIPKIPKTTLKDIRTKRENAVEPPSLIFMGQDSQDKSRGCKGRFRASQSLSQKTWGLAYFRALHHQESSL